jgi:pimeloyl-ACP methyl ester carboxylesterase
VPADAERGGNVKTVEVAGQRIAFRRAGAGPALVLVHGALCDSRVWHDQLAELSDEFTVVAWDAPGCGGSPDPPETFRLPDFADCLAGFVAALGLERPAVLGHSFGGGLALQLYQRHPSLARAFVLAGAYAGWAGSLPPEVVEQRVRVAEIAAAAIERGEFVPRSIPGLFSPALPPAQAEQLAMIMSDVRPTATRVMAYAFAEADLREVLPRVAVPALLLYGGSDERSPLSVARALHASMPSSELVVLPGLGHEAYLESPQVFNDEVRRFLRAVTRGSEEYVS